MATTTTLGAYSTTNSYIKFKIYVTENSYSTSANTSNVTVKVFVYRTNTGYTTYGTGAVYCKINGTEYTATIDSDDKITNSGIYLFSKTLTIAHDTDGGKDLAVYAKIGHSQFEQLTYKGGTVALTDIPRLSTLSVAAGTLNTAQTLTVTQKDSSFTHSIVATCGSANKTICSKSSSTSISFTPPIAWAAQNTTGTTLSVVYQITTYNGDTALGTNSYTKSCTIPSSVKPSCTITVAESTNYLALVAGLSKIKVTVTPTLAYGSAIQSYSTTANGTTYTTATFTTGKLSAAGDMTITAKVTDGRGRTGTASVTVNVVGSSTLSGFVSGELGVTQNFTVNEESSTFKHTLKRVCGSNTYWLIGSEDTPSTSLTTTWTPSLSLAKQNTTGTTVSVSFVLYTYTSGGTLVGSRTYTKTMTIPESIAPSCSIAVSDSKGYLSTYGAYVKGKSKFKVVVTPTLAQESEIIAYSTTANGKTYSSASFTTSEIASSGTLTIASTVTDGRGRSGSASTTASVLAYSAPKVSSLTVRRYSDAACTVTDIEGAYCKVTFSASITALNSKNSATYTVSYKKPSASAYTTKTFTDLGYTVTDGTFIFEADTNSTYVVMVEATDDFSTGSKTTTLSTGYAILNWLSSGLGFAIGKVAEFSNFFDVAWNTVFQKNIYMGYHHDNEKNIYFGNNAMANGYTYSENGVYPHNSKLYGGSATSKYAIGFYDSANSRRVLSYNDYENVIVTESVLRHHIASAYPSAATTLSSTEWTQIALDSIWPEDLLGPYLKLSDGGIVCSRDGYVKLSAQCAIYGITANDRIGVGIKKGDTTVCWNYTASAATNGYAAVNDYLYQVSAGDTFYLLARNSTSGAGEVYAGRGYTRMCVEYVG